MRHFPTIQCSILHLSRIAVVGCGLLLAVSLLGGCATPGTLETQSAPDDFVLGVTVYDQPTANQVSRSRPSSLPRALRPGRYIIEADGVLRASLGNAAAPDVFPPMTRRLTEEQLDRLWSLTIATGIFDDEPPGERIGPVGSYQPPRGRVTALVEAFAAGRRSSCAMGVEGAEQDPQPVRTLTDTLAELAWVRSDRVDVGAELRSRNGSAN